MWFGEPARLLTPLSHCKQKTPSKERGFENSGTERWDWLLASPSLLISPADRLRRPKCWLILSNPRGFSPLFLTANKKPPIKGAFLFGGERGIRTLDTLLTYTHFPGVLLQPLGHLTVNCYRFLSIQLDRSTACSLLRAMAEPYLSSLRDRPAGVQNAFAFCQPLGHLTVFFHKTAFLGAVLKAVNCTQTPT